jgi:hypothetical protein
LGNQLVIYDVLYVCVCILVVVGPLFLLLLLLLFFSDKQSSQMRYFGWTCSNRTLCCYTSLCAFESYSPEKSGEKIKRQWFTLIFFFSSALEREKFSCFKIFIYYYFLFGFNKASIVCCCVCHSFGGSHKKGAPLIFMTSIGSFSFLFHPRLTVLRLFFLSFLWSYIWLFLLLWFLLLGATCVPAMALFIYWYTKQHPRE